jgi:hypothetical protein
VTGKVRVDHTPRERRTSTDGCEEVRETTTHDLAPYIQQIVDAAPPLTSSQKARLATLLHPRPESTPSTDARPSKTGDEGR